MRRLAVWAMVVLIVLAGCAVNVELDTTTSPYTVESHTVTVTNVIDGDTLEVLFPDGSVDIVRLIGVDVPETHAESTPAEFEGIPDTEAGRTWLEEWGRRATSFAETHLEDRRVRIEGDPIADERGGYGRLLVYLSHNGTLFNRALLARGYARLFDSSFAKRDAFAATEAAARDANRGLWGYGAETTIAARSVTAPAGVWTWTLPRAARAQFSRGL